MERYNEDTSKRVKPEILASKKLAHLCSLIEEERDVIRRKTENYKVG